MTFKYCWIFCPVPGPVRAMRSFIRRSRRTSVFMNSSACLGLAWAVAMNSSLAVTRHWVVVVAFTVAERGPRSIRLISPKTSPAAKVPTLFASAPVPMLTSTEPEMIRKAVSPASSCVMIVSPALNSTVCIRSARPCSSFCQSRCLLEAWTGPTVRPRQHSVAALRRADM